MRKTFAALAVAALMIMTVPATANADTGSPPATDDGYSPRTPQLPTLAGSTATGECDRDVPWITYSVELTDPDNQSTGHTARLVLTDGTNTQTIELGPLVNNSLSGRVLWPGASVDAQGVANGWPGWRFVDGQWVETDGNFRWTRGSITAHLEVNPEIAVALSYPPATPVCATDPHNPTGSLAATGLSGVVAPIGIAGAVVAVLGVVLVAVRRRIRANG